MDMLCFGGFILIVFMGVNHFATLDIHQLYISARYPRLFYLWGHSYEFDNDNNWDRIETILQTISSKDDIWCPTNIQLRDYVAAYESLVYSADGTRIYNPTLLEVWLHVDGKDYSVKPGETITIE